MSNEVDILISRMIELEKKDHLEETVKEYKNNRIQFYDKMNSISKKNNEVSYILYPWSRLFEETLFLIYELHRIYLEQKITKTPALLLNYIFKLSNSMKLLFHSGYLEQGLIIYRTIIENIQVEIFSMVDLDFSKKLMDENEDANDFWYKNISKGKISKMIKNILNEIEIKEELIIGTRNDFKNLSKNVHPSVGTPMQICEPLALYPNLLTMEPFGLINYHTTTVYIRIIQSNLEFIKANLLLVIKGKTWFKNNKILKNGIVETSINANAVYKCFYEYYFPQFKKNKKIWNIDNYLDD
jgi:hypothetical protein